MVRDDDFVYNPRVSVTAPVGPINRNKLGRNGVMSPLYTVFRTYDINTTYLEHYFKTKCWHLFMKMNGDSGARFDRFSIATSLFMEMPIPYPNLDEQAKIGCYFDGLDDLITLHQCKCAKNRIKYLNDWEQRKVSEMFKVTRGYVLAATLTEEKKNEEMKYPVYSSQTKDNGLMGYYKDYLYENAITWTTDGANAGTVNFRAGKFYCTNVCGVLLSDKIQANKMISEALNNVAKGYVSYVGNPKLMNNVMADISIMLPQQSEEREQLSKLFSNLDHLITLHQCKCAKNRIKYLNDWEQRKLESLCDLFTDGDWIESRDQSNSGVRLVQTGNVGTTEYLDKENNKKWVTEETFERLHCEEIYPGDILISRLPEPAGRACIMPDLGTRMITAVDCTIVRTAKEYDSSYLVQYLSTPMYFHVVNSFWEGNKTKNQSRKFV